MLGWEKGPGFLAGFSSFWKDQTFASVSNGIICGLVFGIIAIPLIQKAGEAAKLPEYLIEGWIVTTYVGGSIVGILISMYYKLPIAGAWSIPGAFALVSVLPNFTWNEACGGFLASGFILLFLGLTGLIKKVVALIPIPIMMAMVAGTLFGWGSKLVTSFQSEPIVCFMALAGYVLCKKVIKKIPASMGALVFTLIGCAVIGKLNFSAMTFGVAVPIFTMPHFNLTAVISIGIPLALLIVCAENMQAIGVQIGIGRIPPVNAMTTISGIGGIMSSFFGGHNANIAGPMTAWSALPECGEVDKRYVASVWVGIVFALTGIFAPVTIGLLRMMPAAATTVVVGLVLMPMIIDGLQQAFGSGKFMIGSFVSFIVAVSGISIFQVGSAFWALVFGTAMTLLLEKVDYDTREPIFSE